MISPVPLAWAVLAGQIAGGAPPGSEETTHIVSENLLIDERTGTWNAKGHAVLRATDVEVRAEEILFQPDEQRVIARGHVILFEGPLVAFADEVNVRLESGDATLVRGTVLQKRNVSREALLKGKTREELEKLGQTTMSVTGRHVQRLGPDHFSVDGIEFTPCDCNVVKPSWGIRALHADVIPGERAMLTLPVIYIRGVPVLAFPWLYLPMADRRTGLLFSTPGSARGSFFLQQPVFVTLGRSYDMTFTPGYYFGNASDLLSVKGPRLQTEFEYAPSARIFPYGRATLDLVYDLQPRVDPLTAGPVPLRDAAGMPILNDDGSTRYDSTRRGLRGAGSLRHAQELGGGFYDRVDASFVSDGFFPQSLSADLITRETQYSNSTATLYRRTTDKYAGLDVGIRQDLRFGFGFFDNAKSVADFPTHGPNTLQRVPELILDVPEARLSRWLFGSLRIEYSRLAPLFGGIGVDPLKDESGNLVTDPNTGLPQFNPLEGRDRIDFRPRLSVPLQFGPFARLTPYAWYRQDFYVGESTGVTRGRGYPLAGALLETELSRVFPTKNGGWRHSLTPSVEVRYVPQVFGSPGPVYDEIDRALTPSTTTLVQGVVQLSQKLVQTEGAGLRRFIRLDIGQGFDLQAGSAADAFARLTTVAAPLSAGVIWRYDMNAARIAQFSTTAGFNDLKGRDFSLQYDNLILAGPDNLRRGIDELVGPPVAAVSTSRKPFDRAQTLTAHAGIRFKFGIALAYDITVSPENDFRCQMNPMPDAPPLPAFCLDDSGMTKVPPPAPWTIRQQLVTLSINPSCDCWRVDVRALFRREFILPDFRGNPANPFKPDFGITLTLARFGSFGLSP